MSNYKETAVFNVSKDYIVNLKEDTGFKEYIVKRLSSELAERIIDILEREKEIIVGQSDLCVSEFMPTNSVEYRRQINWSPLVRCKDCKYAQSFIDANGLYFMVCGSPFGHGIAIENYSFCSWAERKENASKID